jgi:hypothetical protein
LSRCVEPLEAQGVVVGELVELQLLFLAQQVLKQLLIVVHS